MRSVLSFGGEEVAVSGKEEPICPQCARKRFLTGQRDGLPESSLFMVSFSAAALVEIICPRAVFYLLPNLEQRL